MTLCKLYQPLGNWLAQGLEDSSTRYEHQPSWTALENSSKQGCPFCSHISEYFHARGSAKGWYEREIVSFLEGNDDTLTWVEQILDQEARGGLTNVGIYTGPDTIHFACGDFGFGDDGLGLYFGPRDPGSARLTQLPERDHVNVDPLSDDTFAIVNRWITDCLDNHSDCSPPPRGFLPARLLDVGCSDRDPFLVNSNDVRQEAAVSSSPALRYLTLSHCWGQSLHVTTTKANVDAHRSAIPFSSLNQNFKDAVLATRKMGVRYLWIDSLCIIQDSPSDRETESAQMGDVYMNALLTLAASDAVDGDQGFLCLRKPPCVLPYEFQPATSGLLSGDLWIEAWGPHFDDVIEAGPLSRRAWALQERLLAPRILHFVKSKIIWECRTQTESEGNPASRRMKVLSPDLQNNTWNSASRFSQFLSRPLVKLADDLSPLLETWHLVVDEYTHKTITLPTDRLPALSGLAAQFQALTNDTYNAGLWTLDLPHALCWEASLPCQKSPLYTAPSWSWASLTTGVSYPLPISPWHSFIHIHHIDTRISGLNPLGRIESSTLHMSALLLRARIRRVVDENSARVFLKGGEELGILSIEHDTISMQPWCLLLAERADGTQDSGSRNASRGHSSSVLIVEEVEGQTATFRRAGIVNRAVCSQLWESVLRRDVVLV